MSDTIFIPFMRIRSISHLFHPSDAGITFAQVQEKSDNFYKEALIMTTLTVVRAGLLALTIVALGFVPEVSVANPPSATGHGDFLIGGQLRFFSFSAVKQPNGSVAGQAEIRREVADVIQVIHMDIDCLRVVSQNTAFVSGTVTKSNVEFVPAGRIGVFRAYDNGEGSNSSPDGLSLISFFFPWQNVDCNTPLTLTPHDVQHGNIQVRP